MTTSEEGGVCISLVGKNKALFENPIFLKKITLWKPYLKALFENLICSKEAVRTVVSVCFLRTTSSEQIGLSKWAGITQTNLFGILLNQTKFGLYLHFSFYLVPITLKQCKYTI